MAVIYDTTANELESSIRLVNHEIDRLEYDVKSINRYSRRNSWNKRIAYHTKRKWGRWYEI